MYQFAGEGRDIYNISMTPTLAHHGFDLSPLTGPDGGKIMKTHHHHHPVCFGRILHRSSVQCIQIHQLGMFAGIAEALCYAASCLQRASGMPKV